MFFLSFFLSFFLQLYVVCKSMTLLVELLALLDFFFFFGSTILSLREFAKIMGFHSAEWLCQSIYWFWKFCSWNIYCQKPDAAIKTVEGGVTWMWKWLCCWGDRYSLSLNLISKHRPVVFAAPEDSDVSLFMPILIDQEQDRILSKTLFSEIFRKLV